MEAALAECICRQFECASPNGKVRCESVLEFEGFKGLATWSFYVYLFIAKLTPVVTPEMSLVEIAPQEALKTYFGFDEFKGEQEKAIQSVLDGRDTFVIMPTGGGKSMCYQLPALMMDGVALVISPLIALMKNQVDAIRGHHEDKRVAHFEFVPGPFRSGAREDGCG